jgi:phosphotransferase system  glucose/maltose/N-acetylglucosamine-specific IIC component
MNLAAAMDPQTYLFIVLILTGIFGTITGAVASARGHNFWLFFVVGALVSPVVGIVLAFVIPARAKTSSRSGRRRHVVRSTKTSRSTKTGRTTGQRRTEPDRSNPYSPPAADNPFRR